MNEIYITSILLFAGCVSSSRLGDEPIAPEQHDPRYEVRIGFSDYTYSNGTWKDTIFTSSSLKESEKYINENKVYDTPLVIYNFKTGNIINE
tara:strand:+ start:261 stop:536 length:276 start_codon:yes stop_codon:yes gene_type:complete